MNLWLMNIDVQYMNIYVYFINIYVDLINIYVYNMKFLCILHSWDGLHVKWRNMSLHIESLYIAY